VSLDVADAFAAEMHVGGFLPHRVKEFLFTLLGRLTFPDHR
jgi:hypothetical protein